MATTTENLGLKNPSYEETADIGVINDNMEIIDKAYGGLKGDLNNLNGVTTKMVKSVNILDISKFTENKSIKESDGSIIDNASNSVSDVMCCENGDTIYITSIRNNTFYKDGHSSARYLAIYDTDMALLSISAYANNYEVVSAGAKYFRVVIANTNLANSSLISITLNYQPLSKKDMDIFYDYNVNSAMDGCIRVIDFLPMSFYEHKKVDNAEVYINKIIEKYGNERYTIIFPDGEFNFLNTVYLPYKVSVSANHGTIFNVANDVTAFCFNAEMYPMDTIYDGDGCAFDGGGCRFNLGSRSVAIKVDGTNADANTAFARRYIDNISFNGTDKTSTGIYYVPNHVYLIKHGCLQFSTTICVRWGDGTNMANDSGENMSFRDCTFTHIPFYLNTYSLSIRCTNCSFDYCEAISKRGNENGLANMFMTDCHIERNKIIGGIGLIIRGNTSFYCKPNSNDYDKIPFLVQLGKGSHLQINPSLTNADLANCVVMDSEYIEFSAPRQIGYLLVNPSKNLVPSNYSGADIKIMHTGDYVAGIVSTTGTITLTNDFTGEVTTLSVSNDKFYQVLHKGIYTMRCNSDVSDMIINSIS